MQNFSSLLDPAFFDIFGFLGFLLIATIALWGLSSRKPLPNQVFWFLLVVAVVGLLVDGMIVFVTYIQG